MSGADVVMVPGAMELVLLRRAVQVIMWRVRGTEGLLEEKLPEYEVSPYVLTTSGTKRAYRTSLLRHVQY
eukprot:3940677-Rhodomonas_salina.3